MKVSILHPFTLEAVGLEDKKVHEFHSRPHLKALEKLKLETGFSTSIEYFTSGLFGYKKMHDQVIYKFYPVDFKWNRDHKKWKKQFSFSCLKNYKNNTPDVCIINMSAHSSPFSYKLSKTILEKKKQYIAMLGGQHYSDNERNRDYYKNAHHILVHTHFQKNEMQKMDLFRGLDIRIFPLGVDCKIFTPVRKMNNSPVLLYVGRILELKRIHLAIEALKELVNNGFYDASLDIIGPTSSTSYYKFLKNIVNEFGLVKNVNFHGQKQNADLVPFYQQADLLILPSRSESFGMVMTEAMACGTPVAAINGTGGPTEVIEHQKDGILTTPGDYSTVILDYFKNPKLQKEMSNNARKKVESSYSLDSTYKALKASVESVFK